MVVKIPRRKRNWAKPQKFPKRILIFLFFWAGCSFLLGYRQLQSYLAKPQTVLVLGGHEDRERLAAELAKKNPQLEVWVSSGSPKFYVEKIFTNAGINLNRLHLDYQAQDTVTNFTTLVEKFKQRGINSVYVITSDYHMRRARLIGEIVFGSQGIVLKPLTVSTNEEVEPLSKCLRDGARAIFWLTTGKTVVSLKAKN
ncbi:MAG: YdcF family protein [Cyanobacteria bacterium J083]|nr:MAG: YdcF family protein [Cyanobacteria bacterium J083]